MKPTDSGEGGSVRPGDDYTWRKSSYSSETANCVEVAEELDLVAVRDSKDPDGGILKFSEAAWRGFVADVRAGRYDGSIG